MAEAGKKKKPPGGSRNKARAGPGFRTIGVRVSLAYADWLAAAAKHERMSVATFLDIAAARHAKAVGLAPPPERIA